VRFPRIDSEKVDCPLCGEELRLTDKSWRLTAHKPPKKLEPRDCSCGVETWIGRGAQNGKLFVAVFRANRPISVARR
jgi:hypothetical protein